MGAVEGRASMRKSIAIFAVRDADIRRAVKHVEVTGLPVLIYDRFTWPRDRIALTVVAWTGDRGRWLHKLGPLAIPRFRTLVMNEHGDFFNATPANVGRHATRRARDVLHSAAYRAIDIGESALLWIAAHGFPGLARSIFRRRAAAGYPQPLEIAPSGEGVLTVRYSRRSWRHAEVEREVSASIARYALFLEDGAEWLDPPLFDDPSTFAISRQQDYRDFNEGLFARAPFRQLQPDERARVLAPVSDAILVDRAKLATLGIPKTAVPGSAWLNVFWRAAAAGWSSWSVGQQEPLGHSVDWPYEEAEFVARTPAGLAPVAPDLARGAISTSLAPALPPRGLPRVLVVSPYLPWPLSHGGAVRIWNLCRALADRCDFTLAAFRERGDHTDYAKLREVFRDVHIIDRDEHASSDLSLPRQVREHQSRALQALIASTDYDLLQVEFTHLAHFHARRPSLLVEHDLTFTLYRQYGNHGEADRWQAFERHWLSTYDGVWAMSPGDREIAVAEGARRTWVVANGVDTRHYQPLPPSTEPEVLYVGSFRHRPNVIGFETLRDRIMPEVWRSAPEARLRVVAGPDHTRYWTESALDPRISVHGFVEDLRPLYASASIVAVPLTVSAGTNIKVMEAMACARAVVTTPVGGQGLGLTDDAIVAENLTPWIVELLLDPTQRDAIATRARATVEARFSWESIAREAETSYRELLA
jgi:glycosyltransferase involved in cell wall biosynthesis